LEQKRAELETVEKEQQTLTSERIPALDADKRRWESQMEFLKLEEQIASARFNLDEAKREAQGLLGKDEELYVWENRRKALPYLERLAKDRKEVEEVQKRVETAQEALSQALNQEQVVNELKERADNDQLERKTSLDAAIDRLNKLDEEIARLEGRIEAHSHIKGIEPVCPVCDQELTEGAHQHVRQVLGDERTKLDELRQQLSMAKQAKADAQVAYDSAQKIFKEAEENLHKVIQTIRIAERDLAASTESIKKAEVSHVKSQQYIVQEYPVYAGPIDEVTLEWLESEKEDLDAGLAIAEKEARALAESLQMQEKARTSLETLCNQRKSGVQPLGDTLTAEELKAQQITAIEAFQAKASALSQLIQQEDQARKNLNRLTGDVGSLKERITAQKNLEESASREVDRARVEANAIKQELGHEWDDQLIDHELYQARLHMINTLRITAERMTSLQHASGQLKQVDKNLKEIKKNIDKIPPEYQLSLQEAQQRETEARERHQTIHDQKTRLEDQLADLHQRQRRAVEIGKIVQEAYTEATDWHELADLLKPGGRIQVWITNQEQQQIVVAVNTVLEQLGDSLRVLLGEPLRRTGTEIQDVVVVDTTDPAVDPQDPTRHARHFNLLSGGEQFRVALALALALHKRVAGGAAGTIIVDEGFGDLDGDWRDELARQMTDTVGGILNLELAHSILLCSHSSEVQERFPDRWVVTKHGGRAKVHLIHHDSSVENNEEI
jgi:DNA repair protein SbcC/Rad50